MQPAPPPPAARGKARRYCRAASPTRSKLGSPGVPNRRISGLPAPAGFRPTAPAPPAPTKRSPAS